MRVNAHAASRLKSGKHYPHLNSAQERGRFLTIQGANNLRPVNQNRGLNDRVPAPADECRTSPPISLAAGTGP
jgi:hypothetical protein